MRSHDRGSARRCRDGGGSPARSRKYPVVGGPKQVAENSPHGFAAYEAHSVTGKNPNWSRSHNIPGLNLTIAFIGQRARSDLLGPATSLYLDRIAPYARIEAAALRSEEALFAFLSRQRARTAAWLVLLDSRGQALSSEELARWLGERRDAGQQQILFAVGPADGWSDQARKQAQTTLSLGPMTLPHELARLVLIEQLYRAFTILAGHPYHTGH